MTHFTSFILRICTWMCVYMSVIISSECAFQIFQCLSTISHFVRNKKLTLCQVVNKPISSNVTKFFNILEGVAVSTLIL